jgi:hypothetical protein
MRNDGSLCCYRGGDGISRTRKDCEESIPLSVDYVSALALHGDAHDSVVLGEEVGVAITELLEQARGARDIGEKERDRPRRQS